jgi:ferrous iron transport protein B
MDLPPYRVPTARGVVLHMWRQAWLYLRKAGTIILGVSLVMWALTTFPRRPPGADGAGAEAVRRAAAAAEQDLVGELGGGAGAEARLARAAADVEAVRAAFAAAAARAAATGADGYEEPLREHDRRLRAARETDPAAYAAAVRLVDEVRGPAAARRRRLERERQAAALRYSAAGRLGRALEPAVRPLGFDWRIATALLGSFTAKEVFVAQMGIVFSVGSDEEGRDRLRRRLREAYSPLVGLSVLLFCLISAPCSATLAATRQESGSWRWPLLQFAGLSVLAYLVSLLVYQGGLLLGLG